MIENMTEDCSNDNRTLMNLKSKSVSTRIDYRK